VRACRGKQQTGDAKKKNFDWGEKETTTVTGPTLTKGAAVLENVKIDEPGRKDSWGGRNSQGTRRIPGTDFRRKGGGRIAIH